MERSCLTLEKVLRFLPHLEELEGLRLAIADAAVPDPAKEWARSRAYATIDKRVISEDQLDQAMNEAEAASHAHVDALFSHLRPLFQSYCRGDYPAAVHSLVELRAMEEGGESLQRARQYFEAALLLSLPLSDKQPQILALRWIARVCRAEGHLPEALRYYHRSAELARDAGEVQAEVVSQIGLGNVLAVQGRFPEAERTYRDALARTEIVESTLRLERAQIHTNLGMIATRQDRLAEAEQWFVSASHLWKEFDGAVDVAVCYHNHGLLRRKQGRNDEARQMLMKSLGLELPPALRALILTDMAELCTADQLLAEAERWGREAEENAIQARSPYALGYLYLGLGNIARAQEDGGGIGFYEKALEIAREKGFPLLEGEALLDYALLRKRIGGEDEARSYVERAREIFGELGAVSYASRAEQMLAEPELERPLAAG